MLFHHYDEENSQGKLFHIENSILYLVPIVDIIIIVPRSTIHRSYYNAQFDQSNGWVFENRGIENLDEYTICI